MNADTITLKELADICAALEIAHESFKRLFHRSATGQAGPQDAAKEADEILANLFTLTKP